MGKQSAEVRYQSVNDLGDPLHAREKKILAMGRNCWRIAHADRVAFLVDAAAYFDAFASAAEKARDSILILAWDIDSRLRILRETREGGPPAELGNFLDSIVSRRRGLHVHILAWDFNPIYVFEREPLPVVNLEWLTHKRVHFHLDGNHPVLASIHQKVVVVDDSIAFVGGLDLTHSRWDTSDHRFKDPRRVNQPEDPPYAPFHDVQIAVDGKAAAALGELARERWLNATGSRLRAPKTWRRRDPWPSRLAPDIEDVHLGIARTMPDFKDSGGVREIEALNLDAIASARKSIYIENPYFSSSAIGKAISERLKEESGPEIVFVTPRNSAGMLEESMMDTARSRLFKEIRSADLHGRLRTYYPVREDPGDECINVHSKVVIVDEELVRVGSSNLTNRSMGVDAECDVAIEAEGEPRIREGISKFRSRLLGEHLGKDPEKVQEAIASKGSLIEAIESLREGERTLEVLSGEVSEWQDKLIPGNEVVDPAQPLQPVTVIHDLVSEDMRAPMRSRLLGWAILFAVILALGGLWKFTPLREAVSPEAVAEWIDHIKGYPAAPFLVVGGFVAGGLVAFPVTLLIGATAFAFGPVEGFAYSLAGSFLSAMAGYGIGRLFGGIPSRLISRRKLNNLRRMLEKRGMVAVATVRIVPVAPFTFINVAAGSLKIGLFDFSMGTLIGMTPGLLAISLLGERFSNAIRHPGVGSFLGLAVFVVLLIIAAQWLRRRLEERSRIGENTEKANG